jgi:SAM-dependent methyltransferase
MNTGSTDSKHDCPVCKGKFFTVGAELFDDRYGHPGKFRLVRCNRCGHLMTSPQLVESDLPSLYGKYYPRKGISSESVAVQAQGAAKLSKIWMRWLSGTDNQGHYSVRAGERMLDIGCGSGLSLLEAQHMGADVWGIEADPNVQKIARELGLQVHQGNLYDNPFPAIQFDLVVMNQVIEHIPQPDMVLSAVHARLMPAGRVIMVFPNVGSIWRRLSGYRWINWHVPYHLHHFTKNTFSQMAQRCGFRIVRVRTVTPNLWSVLQIYASLNFPARGHPAKLWAKDLSMEKNSPAQGKGPTRGLLKLVRRLALGSVTVPLAFVNRLVDFFGWGDSLVVEMEPRDPA